MEQISNFLSEHVGRHVVFDTLIVDCERCFTNFMKENSKFMRHPSLRRIVFELDERTDAMVKLICSYGFGVVYDAVDSMLPPALVKTHKKEELLRQVVFSRD